MVPIRLVASFIALCCSTTGWAADHESWLSESERLFQKILDSRNALDGVEHIGGPFRREDYSRTFQISSDNCEFNFKYQGNSAVPNPKHAQFFGWDRDDAKRQETNFVSVQLGTLASKFPKHLGTNEIIFILQEVEHVSREMHSLRLLTLDPLGSLNSRAVNVSPPIESVELRSLDRLVVYTLERERPSPRTSRWCETYSFNGKTLTRSPLMRSISAIKDTLPLIPRDQPQEVLVADEFLAAVLDLIFPTLRRDFGGIPQGTIVRRALTGVEVCCGEHPEQVLRATPPTTAWVFERKMDQKWTLASTLKWLNHPEPSSGWLIEGPLLPLLPKPSAAALMDATVPDAFAPDFPPEDIKTITELVLRIPKIHKITHSVRKVGDHVDVMTRTTREAYAFGGNGHLVKLKKINGIWIILSIGKWVM